MMFDLFGDPVPPNRGKRGRPQHIPTAENRHRVTIWFALGYAPEQVAEALGITMPTLRKHYFSELSGQRTARMKLEAKNMLAIVDQVDKGNASAMALLDKKLAALRLAEASDHAAGRRKVARTPYLGVKAKAQAAAANVTGIYAPPADIGSLN